MQSINYPVGVLGERLSRVPVKDKTVGSLPTSPVCCSCVVDCNCVSTAADVGSTPTERTCCAGVIGMHESLKTIRLGFDSLGQHKWYIEKFVIVVDLLGILMDTLDQSEIVKSAMVQEHDSW